MHEVVFGLLLLVALALPGSARQSPERSPSGEDPSAAPPLGLTGGPQENVRWRVPLVGRGHAAPLVWEDRVLITETIADVATLSCFQRQTGELLWQQGIVEVALGHVLPASDVTIAPLTDGERILACLGRSFCAFDFDGNELWIFPLAQADPALSTAVAAVLHGNLCILSFDPSAGLLALDKRTGNKVWQTSPPQADGSEEGFALPEAADCMRTLCINSAGEQPELIAASAERLSAYDPHTGRLLWTRRRLAGSSFEQPASREHAPALHELNPRATSTTNSAAKRVKVETPVTAGEIFVRTDDSLWCFDQTLEPLPRVLPPPTRNVRP